MKKVLGTPNLFTRQNFILGTMLFWFALLFIHTRVHPAGQGPTIDSLKKSPTVAICGLAHKDGKSLNLPSALSKL
jgi:hypothetical protein